MQCTHDSTPTVAPGPKKYRGAFQASQYFPKYSSLSSFKSISTDASSSSALAVSESERTAIKNPGNREKTICRNVQCFCIHCFAAQDVLHACGSLCGQILGLVSCDAYRDASSQRGGGVGMLPRCVLVCSWRHPLADRRSLPLPLSPFPP